MPVTPYTWQTADYLTASRLNSELYRTMGQYFQPNGIGFHAVRPVYKSFYQQAASFAPPVSFATVGNASQIDQWGVTADTSGWLGYRGDEFNRGDWGLSFLANGSGGTAGNASNLPGGLALITANVPVSSGSGTMRMGLGTSSGLISTGTMQGVNSANVTAPWGLDILDTNNAGAVLTPWAVISSATVNYVCNEDDGSNQAPRLQSFWASVEPANGTTVGSLPTPASTWTNTTPALSAAYMNGAAGLGQVMNLFNMPPLLRATGLGSATSCPTATTTTCKYGTVTYDTYNAYNTSTHTYTAPLAGLYLVYNCFPFDNINSAAICQSGVTVNGTQYWGPSLPVSGTVAAAASKVEILSLNAGDTIMPVVDQTTGSTRAGSTVFSGLFIVLYLGTQGTPSPLPNVPDFTYSWAAGTPAAAMPGLMNAHFANDLNFLMQRPYLLGYQTVAQSGVAMTTNTPLALQSVTGIIHGDNGDNYSGWNATNGNYAATRAGWYLAVQETFMAQPTLTSTPMNVAGFSVTPAGAYPVDFYEAKNATTGHGGAAAVGIYYLRAGDTLTPILRTEDTSSTTTSTYVAAGYNSHCELVWLGQ
jgi:hypothetical protein